MIEVAAALSVVVRYWADFIIIMVFLVFNAIVELWQEFQASDDQAVITGLRDRTALRQFTQVTFVPFDPVRKRLRHRPGRERTSRKLFAREGRLSPDPAARADGAATTGPGRREMVPAGTVPARSGIPGVGR